MKNNKNSQLLAAAFLMATSAIGPGFLTQTTVFTQKLSYSFGFVILISIGFDIVAQLNIWRILSVSNLRASSLGNKVFPHLGTLLGLFIILGALIFNIGNLAGTGMGLEAILGLDPKIGSIISALIVIICFLIKESQKVLDILIKIMAITMLLLIVLMVFKSKLDWNSLAFGFIYPEKIDIKAIITLIGGTVGGYISFAGAHRLLDGGISGSENIKMVNKSASNGILLTGLVRICLYIGTLSVILSGFSINANNPTSSVFEASFGFYGKKLFGLMIWSAAITSVIGATYTAFSFYKDLFKIEPKLHKYWTIGFLIISLLTFIIKGKPVDLLLYAGYVNALILPLGLIIVIIGAYKLPELKAYKHPVILSILGIIMATLLVYFAFKF